MKDVLGSLPEVITAYKNYNLLVPTATDVQLNPFYKFHVEEVPVDLGENSGDIFKVGSVKTGKQDERGKDIWEDVYSLSKPLLNKMAMAAGIQFNPKETYGERIDRVTYRAQAQGAMRKADGTARTETDQKVICLEDEEDKYRIEFSDKAAKGIVDEKQAKAAAEIYAGQWVESKNKWGKKCQAFVIAKEDRERYIERSVMLSFGYSLLAGMCGSALEAVGLDPYVGFFHTDRPGRMSLALDLMEEFRSVMVDRFVLTLINKKIMKEKYFIKKENEAVVMTDEGRKAFLAAWQSKKQETIKHPFLDEKIEWGMAPYVQSMLLARYLRGDLDEYPPFFWK